MSYEKELADKGELCCQYCGVQFAPYDFQTVLGKWYVFHERAAGKETYGVAAGFEGSTPTGSGSYSVEKGQRLFKYLREKGYRHQCFSCFANYNDSTTVQSVALELAGDGVIVNPKHEVMLFAD